MWLFLLCDWRMMLGTAGGSVHWSVHNPVCHYHSTVNEGLSWWAGMLCTATHAAMCSHSKSCLFVGRTQHGHDILIMWLAWPTTGLVRTTAGYGWCCFDEAVCPISQHTLQPSGQIQSWFAYSHNKSYNNVSVPWAVSSYPITLFLLFTISATMNNESAQ